MTRILIFALCAAMFALPTTAQDIAPVISPGQAAEGIFYRSRIEAEAKRAAERQASREEASPAPGTPAFQRKVCADRPTYRRQHGADHPKVRQLEALCAKAGY
ncbi:hypothetical protein DFR49_0788 [Hephaestia caeni]|uniref:UrcA family protein n=1 Tax=Hephaestia caeni TaxID=645617 RepID=A0A397PG83_9SPHN|nr:hypothetical protein DFR49_0788 [Hephaestia caeni]